MAEERKTFKWGDQEYLLDDLLKLHAQYENNYYDFARNRGLYNDEALVKLRDAVANRINNLKQGVSFEGDGVLSTDKADNITILTQKKGLFKKDKYVDQDNTEWAKYYLNKLVSQLKPHKKENPKEWKASEYSLEKFLQYKGVNPQEIFETLDLTDDPDAKRVTTERRKVLLPLLQEYETWLNNKGFEFNKNDNDWDDNHGLNLTTYISTFNDLDDTELARVLREYGAGDAYATAFTSNKLKLDSSTEEDKAKREAREKEEADKKYQEHMRWALDYALEGFTPWGTNYVPYNYSEEYDAEGKPYTNFSTFYADLPYDSKNNEMVTKYGNQIELSNSNLPNYIGHLFSKYVQDLKNLGKKHQVPDNINALLLLALERSSLGFTDLGDGITYLINDSVNEKGVGYTYNKITGALLQVHLHNLAEQHSNIKTEYKKLLHRLINRLYGTDYKDTEYVFETGGIIKAQLGTAIFNPYNPNDYYKERAAKEGVSVKTQKAKDRYMNEDNKSVLNPNAGLTGKDIARLAYAAADIGSTIMAFAPVYGTIGSAVTGLASTAGNFITDMMDDAVTAGDAWGNLGMNLGMDLLGLIPGGGAAAKGAKILKTIKYLVPTMLALPGIADMLANSPEIAASFNKAFGSDEGDKLTYQDYMNILLVINVVTGGTTIARNTYKSATRSKVNPNKIAVEVTDKAGNRKALVFEGDDVDNFKAANNEGKAQEFINKIEGGNNYRIVEDTELKLNPYRKGTDGKRHLQPVGSQSLGKAKVHEIRTQLAGLDWLSFRRSLYMPRKENMRWDNNNPIMEEYAKTGHFTGGSDIGEVDLIRLSGRTLGNAKEAYVKGLRKKALAYNKKVNKDKETLEKDITSKQSEIDEVNSRLSELKKVQTTQDNLSSDIKKAQEDAKKEIQGARKRIAEWRIKMNSTYNMNLRAKYANAIRLELAFIKDVASNLVNKGYTVLGRKNAKNASEAAIAELSELNKSLTDLQQLLRELNTRKNTPIEHSKAFITLTNPMSITFNGKKYSIDALDPEKLMKLGLYKQGGSINRNKINKFLNYGKR